MRVTARSIGVWAVSVLLGLFCVFVGVMKFGDARTWDRAFAHWGYPLWFRPVVGLAEVAAGLLIFVPRVAAHGALLMAVVMVGALGTHIVHGETKRLLAPLVFLGLSAVVFMARRQRSARA